MENIGIKLDTSQAVKPHVKGFTFFRGVTNIISGCTVPPNVAGIAGGGLEVLESFGFKKEPGQIGCRLVSKALIDTLTLLISELAVDYEFEPEDFVTESLDEELGAVLTSRSYYIDADFFRHPEKFALLEDVKPVFRDYLSLFPFDEFQVQNILNRLNSYFVFALTKEWRRDLALYKVLNEYLNTPFGDAESVEYQWICYCRYLNQQIQEPVFGESFSLNDIYIPLRGYYFKKEDVRKGDGDFFSDKEIEVFSIEKHLSDWVKRGAKDDAMRIISGGPGYGKSSFLKIFASHLADAQVKVLFIPLHRFEIKGDLKDSISSYLSIDQCLNYNPMESEEKLVIVFDGLDELSMQGELLADTAQKFLEEIVQKLGQYNYHSCRLQVIVSGRDVIVQQNKTNFRKKGQIIHLLPYSVSSRECKRNSLLAVDQRKDWWVKYGKLKGKNYTGLPKELEHEELDEITSQPLLNYLVALSYEQGGVDFSKGANLNVIYGSLLDGVYSRKYSKGGRLKAVSVLEEKDFERLLQEIALSAWHGNGRTTTIREIKAHLCGSSIERLFNAFVKDAEKGVVSLLAAFYFRQSGEQVDGMQTFEFTHKSFGEYLMAKRIVAFVEFICEQSKLGEKSYDQGCTPREALEKWILVFGPKILDKDIIKFIRNEFALKSKEELEFIQKLLAGLIGYELERGLPVETSKIPVTTYKERNQYAVNSERALFVVLSVVARLTDVVTDIKWTSRTDFGNLLNRLTEQRVDGVQYFFKFLNHLNLMGQTLCGKDFYGANLDHSNLSHCNISDACFMSTNLEGTIFKNAYLADASFMGAFLKHTDFSCADLNGSVFCKPGLLYLERDLDASEGPCFRGCDFRWALLGRNFFKSASDYKEVRLTLKDTKKLNIDKTCVEICEEEFRIV